MRALRRPRSDNLLHIPLNPPQKSLQIRLPLLDALEVGFPLAGHGGALHVRVNDLDEADPSTTGSQWRASVGAGLIWASPFGPLRVDYAVPVVKEDFDKVQEFNFGMSTRF